MTSHHRTVRAVLLLALVLSFSGGASGVPVSAPRLVSPVAVIEATVGSHCPTFSWTEVGAAGYELVVDEAAAAIGESRALVLRVELPSGATSWTPNLDECLAPGRYVWSVGAAVVGESKRRWSAPAAFRVKVPEPIDGAPGAPRHALEGEPTLESAAWSIVTAPPAGGGLRQATAAEFAPPLCAGGFAPGEFNDVPMGDPFCPWIKQAALDGVLPGCGGGNYCPDNAVTRKQVAVTLERAMRGTDRWRPEQGDGATATLPPAGATITSLDAPGADAEDVGSGPSITIGQDGLGLISYRDNTNGDLKVAHCSNVACSAATITSLDAPGADSEDAGFSASITIGSDGLGLISYEAFDDSFDSDLKVAHCSNTECTAATITTLDAPGADAESVGAFSAITMGSDGFGLISYYDATNFDLKVAHCSNPECTAATFTTLDAAGAETQDVGGFTSIIVGSDGLGLISYFDFTDFDLRVAHCSDVACTAATLTALDADPDPSGEHVGSYTSISLGSDGLGLISYRDITAGDLKAAHCSNVDCSAATLSTLDAPGADAENVGQFTSITVGADGLGLISYYDVTSTDLKVAHCSNVDCSAATLVTLDAPGADAEQVGTGTSITLGADGLPLIAYYDFTNGDLKVAHCSNTLCLPFVRRR